ncbi:MAG: DUF1385 domain-containing protein, partial [Candidatus Aegiribacteria sp.]|nr:DUF1385 domain-containing protein [Candidatus Aegiribacteria sp.]MBD3295554.1 DUF1385 domain-containing protein [Candidatus Fermentibacteria bacterium]
MKESSERNAPAVSGDTKAGGQAVIEGVMMRSPRSTAVAVRKKDGGILARKLSMKQLSDSGSIWTKPVFRGAATLIDTLRLGMKALNWSAEIAERSEKEEDDSKGSSSSGLASFLSTVFAFGLAIALFAWLPLQGSKWILESGSTVTDAAGQFSIHLLAGLFRIAAFLIYLLVISLMPDIRRLFMYHGAEHQTIHAWEKGLEPLPEKAVQQSPLHQRCGTSFLLLVMLGTVVFYGFFDSLVVLFTGVNPSALMRVLYHLPLIPLVMGMSYELLKLADRHLETSALARAVTAPGLLLQKLTTRKAGLPEVEVAVASL